MPDYTKVNPLLIPITNSQQCSDAFRKIWKKGTYDKHECVYVIYLNRQREHIYHELLNKGSYSSTEFDLRGAIETALKKRSSNIIIAHNHTSGIAKPSREDKDLTQLLLTLCQTLEINLVDHIIMTKDNYYSFRDGGFL